MSELPSHLLDAAVLARLPPTASRELLRFAISEKAQPHSRRVFVNRALRMEKIRFVGFDLDWTLAAYDQNELSRLIFELAIERLVSAFGYPPAIHDAEFRADFARRGLIVDIDSAVVLKMSRHRYVGRAYHGRTYLDPRERARLYRQDPINPASSRYYFVDTLFELPEINLLSEIVELSKRRRSRVRVPSYPHLFRDVRAAVDGIHADSTLKRRILADLPRYLPRDPQLILALQRLALGGRRLILITNSEWYYTRALCSHLFDGALPGLDSWRGIFDLVVVGAGKPGFFRRARPFVELDEEGRQLGEVETPAWGGIYSGGSREHLMRLLSGLGEEMLYIGDHIYGDVLTSKLASTWRTALIVRELEDEISILRGVTSALRHLDVLRDELAESGQRMDDLTDVLALYRELVDNDGSGDDPSERTTRELLDTLRAEHRAMRQHAKRLQVRVSNAINPYWGSLFKQGSNKSLFGSQVDDFACVYTSRVSNFAYYGSHHYYRVLRDPMMHDAEL